MKKRKTLTPEQIYGLEQIKYAGWHDDYKKALDLFCIYRLTDESEFIKHYKAGQDLKAFGIPCRCINCTMKEQS